MVSLSKKFQDFKEGFFQGLGWSFGATVGFVLVSIILFLVVKALGGLPLIGKWIADIVAETNIQLLRRNPWIAR
ncbi:hypothetical protein A3A76_02730 [Candidatus Woesebacteria bacterium RIFCSPLOWO2_01_FULL_39_23]|uniref:Uncharacterized protein n=1 Tax=Candidatus Woesebacteria bacterium RIFCSPHIGHO2_01_FULL_40_22 TaxID=1802499 RepID=A0A1F7YJE7_9BACT|nr:MAG: hypothetical protein A2141_01290 [Candidatus Woesebacteria bacterium RBG_16_40_11]OGM27392.1 MAG: hypothetical protein A2628_01135 [Candidatus Woesebacteria bacterium RIFCSPHIGHO2_01_FULL_40_22]OGM36157.1 MAG: hypothetical protein A3E41_01415 [Candidatus Woesebacteria bacterium RIFCSPHIGHO2_12_FULL_38_9]OGM62564.1 MAG: hypothetical protein A3A76_02730 [Candidatus Woesebacteria bacterium RIFCSPLOWO2_01_FULL_39_23]